MSESTWQPTPQLLDELIWSSKAAYNRYAPVIAGFSPFLLPDLGGHSYQEFTADGFYGAAYQIGSDIIVAYKGTVPNIFDAYGLGTVNADLSLAAGLIPAAFSDALQFATDVISTATSRGIPEQNIFVTGHSLGGAEAEWVAKVHGLSGATFGAPGIPGYTNGGTGPNLVNYVDYGDPVGNFSSDSTYVTSGNFVSPVVTADHVGSLQYVGSTSDATASEFEAIGALLAVGTGSPFALPLAVQAFSTAISFHNLDNNYAPLLLSSSTSGTPTGLPLSGSVTVSLSLSSDSLGNPFYALLGIPSANLTINGGELFDLPAVAEPTGAVASWGASGTWGGAQFGFDAVITTFSAVVGSAGASGTNAVQTVGESLADFITHYGPSERSVSVPISDIAAIAFPFIGSIPVSLSATAQVGFDVTIAPQADVVMDQDSVILHSLDIHYNGQLLAGSTFFRVRTTLQNSGSLTVAGVGGAQVDGMLSNSGVLQIDGPLAANGGIVNSGIIQLQTASGFTLQNSLNYGVIDANLGGSFSIIGALPNAGGTISVQSGSSGTISGPLTGGSIDVAGGTLTISGGSAIDAQMSIEDSGTVYLLPLGALENVTLSSDGTGQLIGWDSYYAYQGFLHASVLSNVTLEAGVTYMAAGNNVTVLRGTIDNAGMLSTGPWHYRDAYYAIDGSVTLDGDGHVSLNSGTIAPGVNWGLSEVDLSGGPDVMINVDNTLDGYGMVSASFTNEANGLVNANSSAGGLSFSAISLTNRGLMEATNGGSLNLYGNTDNTGGTISALSGGLVVISGQLSGSGELWIDTGSTLELQSGTVSDDAVVFLGAGTLRLDTGANFVGSIAIPQHGGTIDLAGQSASNPIIVGNTLQVNIGGGGTLDFILSGDPSSLSPSVSSDGAGGTNLSIACYAAGTRILTVDGEVRVEDLRVGDRLPTIVARSSKMRPIRWIGRTHVDLGRHPTPETAGPIRVRTSAIADAVPRRDLLLSPDHSVYVDGALIPIHLLVNGATIIREPLRGRVSYFHVELDRHSVILAEGLPAESYLDTGNRGLFANGDGPADLFPEFALGVWSAKGCAELLIEGDRLIGVHRRLADRATKLGYALTDDPSLRIEADGVQLTADRMSPGICRVAIPAGASRVRLVSRVCVPQELDRRFDDRRRLGVAVAAISLGGRELELDDNVCTDGFHQPEGDGTARWRWTDGAATLRLPALPKETMLTLQLRQGWLSYWAAAELALAVKPEPHGVGGVVGSRGAHRS